MRAEVDSWEWAAGMRKVRTAFSGAEGVFLQFGDSLTLAAPNCRWALDGTGHSEAEREFLRWAHTGERNDLDGWHLATSEIAVDPPQITTRTAAVGCSATRLLTGYRGLPPLAAMLARYRPQLALYAVGMSDVIRGTPLDEYAGAVNDALDLFEAQGTIAILSTVTPSRASNDRVLQLNALLRAVAERRQMPLLDLYAEMVCRNERVFEFLDDDGVHLTWDPPDGPPTDANFLHSGYLLRGWLIVAKAMEVKHRVIDA